MSETKMKWPLDVALIAIKLHYWDKLVTGVPEKPTLQLCFLRHNQTPFLVQMIRFQYKQKAANKGNSKSTEHLSDSLSSQKAVSHNQVHK